MLKWLQYFKVGSMVLLGLEALALGQTANFEFEWKGKKYSITIVQS